MFPKTPWRWKSPLYMFNLFGEPATQCKAGRMVPCPNTHSTTPGMVSWPCAKTETTIAA